MPGMQVKDEAERLDLAYLHANGTSQDIETAARIAKEIGAYGVVVHGDDLKVLVPHLRGSSVRPSIVISFPDGRTGWRGKFYEALQAGEVGATGVDLVVNLFHVMEKNARGIIHDCSLIRRGFFEGTREGRYPEIKLISQIPYLWTLPNGRDIIRWLIELLPETGVFCIKDWTTRQNFSPDVKLATSVEERENYISFMAEYIEKQRLNLRIKIAGQVTADNAAKFVKAGADILGISAGKAKDIREALLQK